jgi:pimeloyl-ACP methyl ester carboxylesterase
MRLSTWGGAPPNGRPFPAWRRLLPGLLTGAAVAGAALHGRRVLSALDGTPDPDWDGDVAFPAERTHAIATSDGGALHAEECGRGPPVVLLHGHGADLRIFAPLAVRLAAAGRRVIALDHRGFGRSSPVPTAFGFDGLVDDVATAIETLDLHDAVVVGHSMGGAVALGLAIDRPTLTSERIAALVVVNGSARGPADQPLARARVAVLDWKVTEQLSRQRHGLVVARSNFGADPRRSHVVAVRTIGSASPAERRRGLTRRLLGIDLTPRLGEIGVPVLALAGEADRVLSPSESTRIVAAVAGARLVVFERAGHMLPLERCAEVAEQILTVSYSASS